MKYENQTLGVSFYLPDRLKYGPLDRFEREMRDLGKTYDGPTTAQWWGMNYIAAQKTGLITAWQCEGMAVPLPPSMDDVDAQVVLWTGEQVADYIAKVRDIPKN